MITALFILIGIGSQMDYIIIVSLIAITSAMKILASVGSCTVFLTD